MQMIVAHAAVQLAGQRLGPQRRAELRCLKTDSMRPQQNEAAIWLRQEPATRKYEVDHAQKWSAAKYLFDQNRTIYLNKSIFKLRWSCIPRHIWLECGRLCGIIACIPRLLIQDELRCQTVNTVPKPTAVNIT
jgi:hypothetical protein